MNEKEKHFETLAIRTQSDTTQFSEHSVPLYLTSGFVFDDAEEMRASFAKKNNVICTVVIAILMLTNLWTKFV